MQTIILLVVLFLGITLFIQKKVKDKAPYCSGFEGIPCLEYVNVNGKTLIEKGKMKTENIIVKDINNKVKL